MKFICEEKKHTKVNRKRNAKHSLTPVFTYYTICNSHLQCSPH